MTYTGPTHDAVFLSSQHYTQEECSNKTDQSTMDLQLQSDKPDLSETGRAEEGKGACKNRGKYEQNKRGDVSVG